jgi:hypothetical protein
MMRRAILLALALGCTRQQPPPAQAAEEPQSCLDRELAARGLNQFGDPPATVYTGGTPLMDEKSGKTTDRATYVFSRHPDIARVCTSDAGP